MTKVYYLYTWGGEYGDSYEYGLGIFSSFDKAYEYAESYCGQDEIKEQERFNSVPPERKQWTYVTHINGEWEETRFLTIEEYILDEGDLYEREG